MSLSPEPDRVEHGPDQPQTRCVPCPIVAGDNARAHRPLPPVLGTAVVAVQTVTAPDWTLAADGSRHPCGPNPRCACRPRRRRSACRPGRSRRLTFSIAHQCSVARRRPGRYAAAMVGAITGGDRMSVEVTSPEAVGMSSDRLERIRPAMESYVNERGVVGISTLISRRGRVVHAEQVGFRDKEADRPMTPDAIFRIYSMTKPIVSTALMMLHEEGRFQLEHPVVTVLAGVRIDEGPVRRRCPRRPVAAHADPRPSDAHERPHL